MKMKNINIQFAQFEAYHNIYRFLYLVLENSENLQQQSELIFMLLSYIL